MEIFIFISGLSLGALLTILFQYRSKRERHIRDVLIASRKVQDFLWGQSSLQNLPPEKLKGVCIDILLKRIDKINDLDFNNPSVKTELRKRLLQNAAVSIKILEQVI